MVRTFEEFYGKLMLKVIEITKRKELKEGDLNINYITSSILKEMIIEDLGLKRKVLKSPTKDYVDINVLYRDDSVDKLKIKGFLPTNVLIDEKGGEE